MDGGLIAKKAYVHAGDGHMLFLGDRMQWQKPLPVRENRGATDSVNNGALGINQVRRLGRLRSIL